MTGAARRLAAALLLLACTGLAAGCWSRREPETVAAVTTAALDQPAPDQVRLTVEIPMPAAAAAPAVRGGGGGANQVPALIAVGSGRDLVEAEQALIGEVARELFWAHANVFLVGEAAARAGLAPFLDSISRRYETRRNANVFIVTGEAAQIIQRSNLPGRRPAFIRMRDLARTTREGTVPLVDTNTFLRYLHSPGIDPFLPALAPPAEDSRAVARFAGLAVFRNYRLAAVFSPEEALGVLWLRGDAPAATLIVPCPPGPAGGDAAGGSAAVHLDRSLSELWASFTDNRLAGEAFVETGGEVMAWNCSQPFNSGTLSELSRQVGLLVRAQAEAAVARIRREAVDPVGWGMLIYRRDPDLWKRLKPEWRRVLSTLSLAMRVRVELQASGLTFESLTTGECQNSR